MSLNCHIFTIRLRVRTLHCGYVQGAHLVTYVLEDIMSDYEEELLLDSVEFEDDDFVDDGFEL
ncbi:hypothetical protein [Bermanella sp. R86531]|uniref:hypothetical protein n=1 Tax=Bermanella sp. R86531 TaxID=3093849 RepID=UPI0037C5ED24